MGGLRGEPPTSVRRPRSSSPVRRIFFPVSTATEHPNKLDKCFKLEGAPPGGAERARRVICCWAGFHRRPRLSQEINKDLQAGRFQPRPPSSPTLEDTNPQRSESGSSPAGSRRLQPPIRKQPILLIGICILGDYVFPPQHTHTHTHWT